MRLKKTVNGTDFNYAYNGNLLTHMSSSSEYAHIRYDAQGLPVHMQYKKGSSNPEEYYYMFNAQGDVVALVDGTGKLVVEYSYDAWGQPLTITGSMKDTLGKANPLRYRCYVYDEETGMYYLGSRYYNPVSRVDSDGFFLELAVAGKNLRHDPKGHHRNRRSHYHPDVKDKYRKTPHGASMHDHYYYPD